jgi:hypothetical protein
MVRTSRVRHTRHRGDGLVQQGVGQDAPFGLVVLHPLSIGDVSCRRRLRVQLALRVRCVATEEGDLAVLGLAVVQRLGAGEY